MDEWDGTCVHCGRGWRLQLEPGSEPVLPERLVLPCAGCGRRVDVKRTALAVEHRRRADAARGG